VSSRSPLWGALIRKERPCDGSPVSAEGISVGKIKTGAIGAILFGSKYNFLKVKYLKFYCFSGLKKYACGSISDRSGVSSHRRNSSFSCRERFGPESMAELPANPLSGDIQTGLTLKLHSRP